MSKMSLVAYRSCIHKAHVGMPPKLEVVAWAT